MSSAICILNLWVPNHKPLQAKLYISGVSGLHYKPQAHHRNNPTKQCCCHWDLEFRPDSHPPNALQCPKFIHAPYCYLDPCTNNRPACYRRHCKGFIIHMRMIHLCDWKDNAFKVFSIFHYACTTTGHRILFPFSGSIQIS